MLNHFPPTHAEPPPQFYIPNNINSIGFQALKMASRSVFGLHTKLSQLLSIRLLPSTPISAFTKRGQKFFHVNRPIYKIEDITVTFVQQDGTKLEGKGKEGDNLLDIIINNDIDIDGFGACEGTLACSTCHVILKQDAFDKLPEEATDEELDMLDLAYGLTDTSRLGCQVCITKELSGIEVQLPEGVNDQR